MFGSTGGSHPLARFTEQEEAYGPRLVEQLVRNLSHLNVVIDLGVGAGRDLEIVRRLHPQARLVAGGRWNGIRSCSGKEGR